MDVEIRASRIVKISAWGARLVRPFYRRGLTSEPISANLNFPTAS